MREWFEKVTIGNLLDRLAQRCGEREALAFAGQRWSFQQLQADSDRAARGLMQCGIEPGDKVAYGSRTAPSGCTFCLPSPRLARYWSQLTPVFVPWMWSMYCANPIRAC